MDLIVTRLAQGHQVILRVPAALRHRQDVVDFLNRCEPPFFEAPLTQRMLRHILVTDAFPSASIFLVYIGASLIAVILSPLNTLVLRAVLPICKTRTAGM